MGRIEETRMGERLREGYYRLYFSACVNFNVVVVF